MVDKGYAANRFVLYPSFNLNLKYQHNANWAFFAGWLASDNSAIHMNYGTSETDFTEGKLSMAAYTPRLQLGAQRYLTTCTWFKIKRREGIMKQNNLSNNHILYAVLFRLRALAGASYDYIMPFTDEGELEFFSSGSYRLNVVDRSSYSIFVGLNLQFFNFKKDHFQLSVLYSKGLSQVLQAEVDYSLLSGDYHATIGSRGSYFLIQLGYPIKLVDFEKQKRRRMMEGG
jgi:hypothetical protein